MSARTIATALAVLALAGSSAMAEKVTNIGAFEDWTAYSYKLNGKPECYTFSRPTAMKPARLDHGEVVFMITAKSNAASRTEANFQAGYTFKAGSNVVASIGDDTFTLTTDGSNAWLRRADREADFLKAIRAGDNMELTATSARGNDTSYVVSLDGVTAATNRILTQCR
ncbi:hypothetical protein GCM10007301_21930 [Azorhizobium oxalatiphilum]|uniref:Uncharacterized protein n=1 Tax=Azorhizobium oxalatiphilum TaxID=980631 RepID=A0A917BWN2_9HYPH|nr:invasion associated locus B family protein [Azorhizobium oxalatiphilum]GGF61796.1 hypothetical protein GCM10007301_21930 [Azorhizobium oxalatiphilum]